MPIPKTWDSGRGGRLLVCRRISVSNLLRIKLAIDVQDGIFVKIGNGYQVNIGGIKRKLPANFSENLLPFCEFSILRKPDISFVLEFHETEGLPGILILRRQIGAAFLGPADRRRSPSYAAVSFSGALSSVPSAAFPS